MTKRTRADWGLAGVIGSIVVLGALIVGDLILNNPTIKLRRERSRIQERIYEIELNVQVRELRAKLDGMEEAERSRCECGCQ